MQWTSRDFPRTADDFVLLILQTRTFFDLGWTVKLISGEFVLDWIHQTTGIIISCAKIGYWVALERDEAAMFWCWMCLLFHSIWTPYILQKHFYSLLEFHSIQPFNNGSITACYEIWTNGSSLTIKSNACIALPCSCIPFSPAVIVCIGVHTHNCDSEDVQIYRLYWALVYKIIHMKMYSMPGS